MRDHMEQSSTIWSEALDTRESQVKVNTVDLAAAELELNAQLSPAQTDNLEN